MSQKSKEYMNTSWVNSISSLTIYIFTREDSHDESFLDVGLSSDWGVFTLGKNDRICNDYDGCVIPFLEFFNHLMITSL